MMILPLSISDTRNNYTRGLGFKSSALLSDKTAFVLKKPEVNSADYIKYIYGRLKRVCNEVVEINVETNKLQDIVHSDEPRIFIMNHTSTQWKDINAAKFFNTLLYREYIYQSRAETCPRSRILTNTGLLQKRKDGGEELKWMGAVPINAGLGVKKDAKNGNAVTLKHLTKELINGDINLFLFPEGALAALTFLPLKYKFQPGVSAIIRRVLEEKNEIRVTPLGFAHNSRESAIHIGDEIVFSKTDGEYYATRGNADSKYFDKKLAGFFGDKEKTLITENGTVVNSNRIVPFISGILMRNLECCTKEAKKDLKNSSGEIYTL